MAREVLIPLNINLFFVLLGFIFLIGALIYGYKKNWTVSQFGTVVIGVLLFSVFGAVIPFESTQSFQGVQVDHVITIEARIKPWTFNVTSIDGQPPNASLATEIPAGSGYPASIAYQTIVLKVNQTYELRFKAIDTDHGVHINDLTDYRGEMIDVQLPQHVEVSVIIKPQLSDVGNYTFFCTFFCGAGHGNMRGTIMVVE